MYMDKHFIRNGLIFASTVLLFFLIGCLDDSPHTGDKELLRTSLFVDEAMNDFNTNVKYFHLYSPVKGRSADEELLALPVWEAGQLLEIDGKELLEIPIEAPLTIVTRLKDLSELDSIKQKKKQINTNYNLLVEKLEDGSFSYTVARVTCSDGYRRKSHRRSQKITLNHQGIDKFSGVIMYYTLDGEFISGNGYESGVKTTVVTADSVYIDNDSIAPVGSRGYREVCYTDYYWVEDYRCTGYISNGELHENECDYTGGHMESYTTCRYEYFPDGGGSGGGGGGSNNNDNKCSKCNSNPCICEPEEADPCSVKQLLNGNTSLNNRITELFDEMQNGYIATEDGWIKTKNGTYHEPNKKTANSVSYTWSEITDKNIVEWYHTHPSGSVYPSFADLEVVCQKVREGYVSDFENFTYGITSCSGCISFVITSVTKFYAFCNDMGDSNVNDDIELDYEKLINNTNKVMSMEERLKYLINFLNKQETGLSIMFKEYNGLDWEEWEGKKIETDVELQKDILTNIECN